eukprot:5509263-Pyramimonas_sp.AAC.2
MLAEFVERVRLIERVRAYLYVAVHHQCLVAVRQCLRERPKCRGEHTRHAHVAVASHAGKNDLDPLGFCDAPKM